jgi:hypothetical protein
MNEDIEFRHLRYFLAVAETLHFSKFRGIACHAHVNHTFVGVNVISSVRNGCALRKNWKIVDVYLRRLTFLMPFPPVILEVSDTFYFFVSAEMTGSPCFKKPLRSSIDITKLPVAIRPTCGANVRL